MLLAHAFLAIPLFASAIPTSRLEGFTLQDADLVGAVPGETETLGWTMDLDELRLVQFAEDEPAVYVQQRLGWDEADCAVAGSRKAIRFKLEQMGRSSWICEWPLGGSSLAETGDTVRTPRLSACPHSCSPPWRTSNTLCLAFPSMFSKLIGSTLLAYPSLGNYTKPIQSVIKGLNLDNMKQFLSKFSR